MNRGALEKREGNATSVAIKKGKGRGKRKKTQVGKTGKRCI